VSSMLLTPLRHLWAGYIRLPSTSQGCNVAVRRDRFGNCLFVLIALMIAVDDWLTLGPWAQGPVVAAAVLRRLRGERSRGLGNRFAPDRLV
jgi:hypothetical protein